MQHARSNVCYIHADMLGFQISDYVVTLLMAAHDLPNPLFLLTTAATFAQCSRLTDTILAIEPKSARVTPEKVSAVVYQMFEQHVSLYLSEESTWTRSLLASICTEWDNKLASQNASAHGQDPTFLNAHNPQQVKRNVLANFGKALLLPVTIVPKTVVFGVNAITYGGSMAFNVMSGGLIGGPAKDATGYVNQKSLASGDALEGTPGRPERARTVSMTSTLSTPLSQRSLSGSTSQLPDFSGFQMLLSIETAMQLIQADRDCLKRIQTFSGYSKSRLPLYHRRC
jgi:recyclin-1